MVTTFNKTDLVRFGEYLLSQKRTDLIIGNTKEGDNILLEERLREVYHADIENWKGENERQKIERNLLKEINSMCEQSLDPEGFEKWESVVSQLKSTRQSFK